VLPMDFRDGLSALFPPPRDDEPASLRHDIINELSDHLACAYNRELLRGADSSVAQQFVLDRFGDPASVARRLWLDAMKGKIMAQRVFMASCVLVTAASLALVGLVWRQLSMTQREAASAAAAAMRAMALQNDKAQATQEEMLKQMREMSEAIRTTRSLDWNPVTFKVTEGTLEGTPVAGVTIALDEQVKGSAGVGAGPVTPETALRVTDVSGSADFGVVHPGRYFFRVYRDLGKEYLTAGGEFSIEPGSKVQEKIVCPKGPLERAPVRVRAAWPAELEKESLVLYASFSFIPTPLAGREWTLCDGQPSGRANGGRSAPRSRVWPANRAVFCGPGMSMAQVLDLARPLLWTLRGRGRPAVTHEGRTSWYEPMTADFRADKLRDIREPGEAMEWERGTYQPSGVIVLHPTEIAGGNAGTRRFDVLFTSQWQGTGLNMGTYYVLDKPPDPVGADAPRTKVAQKNGRRNMSAGTRPFNDADNRESIPWASWTTEWAPFEVQVGRINEYTIKLPEEVLNVVRDQLKERATAP
jgi:hypothetical protein